jgi:hypothetical protein
MRQTPAREVKKTRARMKPGPVSGRSSFADHGSVHLYPKECAMTYLELAPAIAAIRSRPEEFEFSNDTLHHPSSRHRFRFLRDDDVEIHADCDCSTLRASPGQARAFHAAYREWHSSYWRPLEINREFASHFELPVWRRMAIWLLRYLLSRPQVDRRRARETALPLQSVG